MVAQLSLHPLDKTHRPSADVLFRSAAEIFAGMVASLAGLLAFFRYKRWI